MGYRKIKPVLINFAAVVKECGLRARDDDYPCGHHCGSKSKDKSYPERCYPFDCPLASEATLANLKKHDPDLYEEYKDEYEGRDPENTSIHGYVVQYRECTPVRRRRKRDFPKLTVMPILVMMLPIFS